MKGIRHVVPVLGAIALAALFFKLPETAKFFKCSTCFSSTPYFALIGAAYFSVIISVSLLFPFFPSRQISYAGLIWALLLALTLTYMNLPAWCSQCLISHFCNILIWSLWAISTPEKSRNPFHFGERLYLVLLAPVAVVALFSCLNLTFMAYGHKEHQLALEVGDEIPAFFKKDDEKGMVINFIAPNCPYCQEQMPILKTVAKEVATYRFITVSAGKLIPELISDSSFIEWIEDKEGKWKTLFKVSGYPTMYVVGSDGKITQVILGVPDHFKAILTDSLVNNS